MATRTSIGSGLWSAVGTWDTGVPLDNDVVVIAAGHVVEFDVDQSGFVNGIDGITITGTLKLMRTAGTYYLKVKPARTISGAGTFDCGASALDPIPFTAKHTIALGLGRIVGNSGAGMTMTVFAAEPTIKYVLSTALEPIGETVIAVDTSVIGDIWAAGDTIRIGNETRTIAAGGIAAGTITITSGLTAAKGANTLITLLTRNVKFSSTSPLGTLTGFQSGKLTIGGGWFADNASYQALNGCTGVNISGGVFDYNYDNFYALTNSVISGGVFYGYRNFMYGSGIQISGGVFSGANADIFSSSNIIVSGGKFFNTSYVFNSSSFVVVNDGTFTRNTTVFNSCPNIIINGGTYTYNTQVLLGSSGVITNSAGMSGQTSADIKSSTIKAYNTTFGSSVDLSDYSTYTEFNFSESFDHGQQQGAYKAWSQGGVTTKQATTYPSGKSYSMQTVLESATKYGWWQREVVVGAGASVNITSHLRKSASMGYLPRVIIFNKASADPWAGGAGLDTFTMTDSVDTWESDAYTYYNSTSEDVTLIIRVQGKNATGNMFSLLEVEQINVDLTSAIAKIDVIDGLVDAIKAKTDQLAFTVANQVDANALTGGGGASAEDVADAVWDEAIAGHVAAGSFGAKNQKVVPSEALNDYKADVSGLATSVSLATVDSVVDAIKLKTDNLPADPASEATVNTRLATSGYTAPPSVSAIVTGVWGATTRTLTSFGTLISDIWGYATRTLSAFGFTVSAIPDANVALIKAKTDNLPASPAAVGSAMTLTAGERTAIANEVESQIINEADAERVLTAITDKIASVNPSLDDLTLAGIASAVRTELGTELARIDATISSRLSSVGYTSPANADVAAIKAKTDNLPNDPADQSILAALIGALPAVPSEMDIVNALKSSVFDGVLTFEDSIKLYNAILFGKLDGGGTGTLKFRNPADTKDRVTVVVDLTNGDRDDITLDPI